jgi:choline-sulfatase
MTAQRRYHDSTTLALAGLILLLCTSDVRSTRPVVRNVLIVTLDTTRADVLTAYGSDKVETPALDRLSREGVVFEEATSPVPLTLPAHASLFTGLLPPHHGVRDNVDSPLGNAYTTLAEVLRENGVRTAAFVSSAVVDGRRGLAQGFDTYSDGQNGNRNPRLRRPANVVVDDATRWIARQQTSPFFAWVHLYDAHAPYTLPEPYRTMYEDAPYLGAIAFMDAQLARLLQVLDDRHGAEDTLVVIAADHGESLGDHGEDSHGILLYQSTLRVPMIVRAPGLASKRVSDVVRLVDVMPTVLDLLGLSVPAMDGVSLVPLMTGQVQHVDLDAYAESLYPRHFGWGELHALRAGRFKFVSAPQPELYDLETDPAELRNIYRERRDLGVVMNAAVDRMSQSTAVVNSTAAVDPESVERLAALGYVSQSPVLSHAGGTLDDPKDCIGAYNAILRNQGVSPLQRGAPAVPLSRAGIAVWSLQRPAGPKINAASSSWRSFAPAVSCSAVPSGSLALSGPSAAALEQAHPRGRMPLGATR